MKRVYAFDIDGVICETRQALKADIERELGVVLRDGGEYDTFGYAHDNDEVMIYLREHAMTHWRRPQVCGNGEANGQDVVNALAGQGQFAGYVTRRHPDIEWPTYKWLVRRGFPSHEILEIVHEGRPAVTLTHPLHHMVGDIESKADAARAMGATHLVEDSGREAKDAARDGIHVVVLRQPYNRSLERELEGYGAAPETAPQWAARISFIDSLGELLEEPGEGGFMEELGPPEALEDGLPDIERLQAWVAERQGARKKVGREVRLRDPRVGIVFDYPQLYGVES